MSALPRNTCSQSTKAWYERVPEFAGACLLLVEEQERPLRAWDFVHCPPGTRHVFVRTGDQPCVIFMTGARHDSDTIGYPLRVVAQRESVALLDSFVGNKHQVLRIRPGTLDAMQRRLLGLLFAALAVGLGLIAVFAALAGGGAWVIALAAAALAVWMGDLARRVLVRRRA